MNKIKKQFLLDKNTTFLNHGSFGACPAPIFKAYQNWQLALEMEPVQFYINKGPLALKQSKEAFAGYFNCDSKDFFFTPNPSTAINTIVKSLDLKVGDEILATNLEYGAVDKTWKFYCEKKGAKYVQQNISFPIKSQKDFIEQFWKGLSSKTKAISICHITSSTALILPVEKICKKAKELGLITIIDGAHVPGHIPLNLSEIDVDIYTGALHKWFLAPKGFSFLYVNKKIQKIIEPLIVSWGYESDTPSESQFLDWHEFNGTRDFSAYLCMPSLLKFRNDFNWDEAAKNAREMILKWYPKFCDLMETEMICPLNNKFLAQMCSIPINTTKPLELKDELYQKYKIEIPITNVGKQYFIRVSFQAYNEEKDLEYLYESLEQIKIERTLLY